MLDTSGYGAGERQELFDAMPAVKDACQPRCGDLLENPPNRFWFLVNKEGHDDPIAAVELTTATGWDRAGRAFDLRTNAQSFEAEIEEAANSELR